MSEKEIEIKGKKVFYKKRKCVFCERNMMIKMLGDDFVELICEDHPNYTLYIVDDTIKFLRDACKIEGEKNELRKNVANT